MASAHKIFLQKQKQEQARQMARSKEEKARREEEERKRRERRGAEKEQRRQETERDLRERFLGKCVVGLDVLSGCLELIFQDGSRIRARAHKSPFGDGRIYQFSVNGLDFFEFDLTTYAF